MSIKACLPDLVADGKISPEKAREAGQLFDELERVYRRQFGDQTAAAMASERVIEALERAAKEKRRQTLLQLQAQRGALAAMARFGGGSGGRVPPGGGSTPGGAPGGPSGPIDPRAAVALFDRDSRAPFSNVEGRRKAIIGRSHAMMDRLLREHSRNLVGEVRRKAQLQDVVSELFGRGTGNEHARELADAWSRTAEMLRQRFNAAGGDIAKLEGWALPQAHDARAVRQAGYEAWRDFTIPLLDRGRMIDRDTGAPFTDEKLELVLRDVWETIRTDGWASRSPGQGGMSKLANRRQEHRFMHFAGPDAWTAYAEKFGSGNAFDAMMGHIEGMSRDIALMEILGPNPNATVRWLKDTIEKSAQLDTAPGSKRIEKAQAAGKSIDRLYSEITGSSRQAESRAIALGFSSLRALQTAAKLGSATLSAVTDLGFQWSARRFAGVPASSTLGGYLRQLNPASAEDRLFAVRAGLIADQWSTMASGSHRYLNEELTGEISRRLAEGVLRVSGLSAWTQAGRWAFGMEAISTITGSAARSFDQLDPAFRGTLERYGVGADGWDIIRRTAPREERGAKWILPADVSDQALGDRLLEMILSETDFAVPVADLRTRAMINSVAPRGTWIGEVTRSALLFKSFGLSVMISQLGRVFEAPDLASKAGRMLAFVIPTTIMGGVAIQLKEVAKGRDPRPMTDEGGIPDPRFWSAAMLQGGGFGIMGDFITASQNRFGGGIGQSIAGPIAQDADAIAAIFRADAEDRDWKIAKFLKQATPGSSLWYLRLGLDRMIADQLQAEIDPNYRDSWKRLDKAAAEWGQEYWWATGETSPARAPDFANAWEGEIPEEEE